MGKKVNIEDLINWWLEKYHDTNLDKVLEDNPEWKENLQTHSREFYQKYAITKKQHDEWLQWAQDYTKKVTGIKGKLFDKNWCWVYLDCAPSIIKE